MSFCSYGSPVYLSAKTIEEYLSQLPADAKDIYLIGEGLTYLPSLARFTELKRLDVSHNRLTSLPDDLGKCTKLTHLSCHDNKLTTFPASIVHLVHLKHIFCEENRITHFPDPMPPNIVTLIACKNQLASFPVLRDFPLLTYLNLTCNRLRILPNVSMPQLKYLAVTCNPLLRIDGSWKPDYFDCTNTTFMRRIDRINARFVHFQVVKKLRATKNRRMLLVYVPNIETMHTSFPGGNPYRLQAMNLFNHQLEELIWKFRFAYYLGKCRRRLRQWLFSRVLLRISQEKYHPRKLQRFIDSDLDLMDNSMVWL